LTAPATILVVDDTPQNVKLLADLLSAKGYAVVTASNGAEGLAKVRSVKPDLVLLDVVMPGMSGYEVCKHIRADSTTGVLPVVMVTALDPTEERIKGLEAGADEFLTKPINQPELLARVRSLLRIKSLYDTVQTQAIELADLNEGLEQRVREQIGQLQRLAQLKRFFPPQLAERIVGGELDDPLATHRREVTVAFLDLGGFNAFADISEPEEVMALLRSYHREMGASIESYGGTLEQLSGNAMMVVFNDPVIVEDPAARAVAMAMDMQRRFAQLMGDWRKRGYEIALSIGIAHGYATIGAIGYEARVGYGVIGRVTNLAARLCAQAQPGQVLVSASVLALVEDEVEAQEVPQVDFQGFVHPVAAFGILGLKPPARTPEAPAWPLKIYALGQFALQVHGQALTFSRKAQKKPLDLLRMLIALGGVRVETSALTGLLWPDAEGDAAKISFDSNLYRLRKLLGVDDLLTLSEGKLSLDRERCWVDIWAVEDLVARVEREVHGSHGIDGVDCSTLAKELLRLYSGHFLEKESQEAWAIAARDRLKAKFLRAVTLLGSSLEAAGQWEQATVLYSQALELDNLAEGLYRRLMIAYRERGEPAEALNVYRRCRHMLSIVLSAKPSAETEAIRSTLA
jgi:class 3 adenylate cyclase/CheY-like chemotaxis protein/DNA-binding SARP family transcriptional activator